MSSSASPQLSEDSHRAGVPSQFSGRVLGETYRIIRQLDEGGMSRVFEAEHLRLHRHVAVKLLSADVSQTLEMRERFNQEADMVSQLEHPHVVTVLDFDVTESGEPYLVLELLRGETLADRLARHAPLPVDEAAQIVVQIASGLTAAHRASIVHRDLKPGNIFLTGSPEDPVFAKLLDFGIGRFLGSPRRITRPRTLLGTPDYMSPEQAMGRPDLVDARTDEYALAVVSYEMLTGAQPFADPDITAVLDRVLHWEPPPASSVVARIPHSVDGVLSRALAKEPSARFPSVAAFSAAFTSAIGAGAAVASPSRTSERAPAGPEPPSAPPSAPDETARTWLSAKTDAVEQRVPAPREREEAVAVPEQAVAAPELAEGAVDGDAIEAARQSGPLLADVFIRCLGSSTRRLFVEHVPARGRRDSRVTFLLSRLEPGMTIEEVLDVSAMPRVEALSHLVHLVACGSVTLDTRNVRSSRTVGGSR